MELIRGVHNLRAEHRGNVVTIGNFDGVHSGHGMLLARLRHLAVQQQQPLTVVLFEPQPREYFAAAQVPARLSLLREKVSLLARRGVDRILCLAFNQRLRELTAGEFVQQVLVQGLGASFVAVGDDFRFGCDRQGDFALLQREGARCGFQVEHTATFQLDDERVSSSRVRTLLASGNFRQAACLLGRAYRIEGRVRRDRQLGRTIGVPTANVPLPLKPLALRGVYVVVVCTETGPPHWGVANIGWRPTVGSIRPVLEVHLLDFCNDLYDQRLTVFPCQRLRDEQRFDGIEALRAQLLRDISAGRRYAERTASAVAGGDPLSALCRNDDEGRLLLATVPALTEGVL